jgi:hypothetical protein
VYRGGVTFLQVKRLTGRQAEIGSGIGVRSRDGATPGAAAADPEFPAPWPAGGAADGPPTAPLPVAGAAAAAWPGTAAPGAGTAVPGAGTAVPGLALPDVGELLDEAFGERRG